MRVFYRGATAMAVLALFLSTGSNARGELAAYWSFDSDFTSAGSRSGMDGTAVENSGGNVTIGTGTGEWKVGGGALRVNDPPG
ncbi:MAG: hypothetical protein GX621_16215, partial [Pirellulaceae bacterium]|nr:hypothetical protein [Pirellulaceae bacterium]